MSAKERLVYIAPSKSSFVLQDIAFLREKFVVTARFFNGRTKWKVPFKCIRLFFDLLFQRHSIFLVSFGGYHSFLAVLVAKIKGAKCYIILNGTDCAAIPEFNYGHLRTGLIRRACVISYKWADGLFPVSDSLLQTTNTYAFSPPKSLGLKSLNLPYTSAVVIPNGFDTAFWKQTNTKEANTFITVSSPTGYALKGLDLFLDLANSRPNDRFRIAGISQLDNCPSNVELLGYLKREQLRDQFSKSHFFCQLSIWEGFGCALCEAMLCECIPIVSDVNMLPEIVGDLGIVLPKRDAILLRALVSEEPAIDPKVVRQRIIDNYPIKNRIEQLTAHITNPNIFDR